VGVLLLLLFGRWVKAPKSLGPAACAAERGEEGPPGGGRVQWRASCS
jgi:hypothetical protein